MSKCRMTFDYDEVELYRCSCGRNEAGGILAVHHLQKSMEKEILQLERVFKAAKLVQKLKREVTYWTDMYHPERLILVNKLISAETELNVTIASFY